MTEEIRMRAEEFVAEYASKSPGAFVQAPMMVTAALRDHLRDAGIEAVEAFGAYRGLPPGYEPEDSSVWTESEHAAFRDDPWEVHHWVVCGDVIIDVCSCRFGSEGHPVIITRDGDPRYGLC